MYRDRARLGKWGEQVAVFYLRKKGFLILEKNFRTRFGEIDIIARDSGGGLVFVEVKTRSGGTIAQAVSAVNYSKRARSARAATSYVQRHRLFGQHMRFAAVVVLKRGDVVTIRFVDNISLS